MLNSKLTKREITAVFISVFLLIGGIFLGISNDPAWLGRIGALIIVVGVIFAVTNLPEALERRVRAVQNVTNAIVFNSLITEQEEKEKRSFSKSEQELLRGVFEKITKPEIERKASLPKRRFLAVEATIICLGTMVNGFGEWVIETLMCT